MSKRTCAPKNDADGDAEVENGKSTGPPSPLRDLLIPPPPPPRKSDRSDPEVRVAALAALLAAATDVIVNPPDEGHDATEARVLLYKPTEEAASSVYTCVCRECMNRFDCVQWFVFFSNDFLTDFGIGL